MLLTQKEITLLKDLKNQEQLCVDKYERYASEACRGDLKDLFLNLKRTEQQHLNTVNEMLSGKKPSINTNSNQNESKQQPWNSTLGREKYNEHDKKMDKYLCTDALANGKQISSVYNTSIFEVKNSQVREVLNHIQKEEQNHGERIYNYMEQNGMYSQS